MLTAQKTDNEFQAQQICYERLMLSQQTEEATREYTEKINNRVLLFNAPSFTGADRPELQLTYANIVGEPPDGMNYRLISAVGRKIMAPNVESLNARDKELYDTNPELFWIDPDVANADLLEQNLRDGNYYLQAPEGEDEFKDVSLDAAPFINDTYNKMDDAQAENEYNAKKEQFQNFDKKYELKLKQLDSEHKALETEMDSVKKVIEKNVESTFKTFG